MPKSQSNRTRRTASGGLARGASATNASTVQPQPVNARTRASRGPTKADLEKRIAELEAALEAAQQQAAAAAVPQIELEAALEATQQQEKNLKQQIADLQEDFGKQQDRLFELTESLGEAKSDVKAKTDQLSKITAELEEAKQVILKMTEAKAQPRPAAAPIQRIPDRKVPDRRIPDRRSLDMRPQSANLKRIPDYAIQKGPQPGMLTNDEIGWVD